MHVIWNLLRAELSSHATMLRSFVVVAAIISTANLVMGGATPAIAVCVLTVAFLPSALFAQDERAHLDTMYSVLPVTRAQFVVARYDFDISIDNYSGHTRVFYEHEDLEPTTMFGGDFRIKNAAAGSVVTLTTDSTGLNTGSAKAADKNLVNATLNALANKLWYTAYTTGERNLTGKAEIAEGLTA